ncbi:hypothetical protein [Streptomyces sp. NPDC088766]|uniref:hypothetical protein n=1 Tax=Streptomyces sp. NPDC088766 TaxID=3365893 RepID=UPI00381C52EE
MTPAPRSLTRRGLLTTAALSTAALIGTGGARAAEARGTVRPDRFPLPSAGSSTPSSNSRTRSTCSG